VSHEDSLRVAAVVAAAALVAAPYWQHVRDAAGIAWEYAKARKGVATQVAAAALILLAAWGKIPLPTLPAFVHATVSVETPSESMQAVVAPVAVALRSLPMGSRMPWAQTWSKAALVVAGDPIGKEIAFTDTRSLRAFTALALDIAWRRIGGNQPGNESLRQAVEAAYKSAIGDAEVPVTKDMRDRYAELAKALAWAGINGG